MFSSRRPSNGRYSHRSGDRYSHPSISMCENSSSPCHRSHHHQCSHREGRFGCVRNGTAGIDDQAMIQRQRNSTNSGLRITGLSGLANHGMGGFGAGLDSLASLGVAGSRFRDSVIPSAGHLGIGRGGGGGSGSGLFDPNDPHLACRSERSFMGLGRGGMSPLSCPRSPLIGQGGQFSPLLDGVGMGRLDSRPGSIRPGLSGVNALDLMEMAGGARLPLNMSNYKQPYVEDYESEIDELERRMDELQMLGLLERYGDGMGLEMNREGSWYGGSEFGDRGRLF